MTTLADTSIWVDGLRRDSSWLSRTLSTSAFVGYTEPVLMELLMGARDDAEWQRLRRFILAVAKRTAARFITLDQGQAELGRLIGVAIITP